MSKAIDRRIDNVYHNTESLAYMKQSQDSYLLANIKYKI